MRLIFAVTFLFVSAVACSGAPAPQVLHPQYRYAASYAPGPFAPGAAFHVDWTPELIRTDSAEPYEVRLCIGVLGPFESASALKESGSRSSGTRPDCPPTGAVVSSGRCGHARIAVSPSQPTSFYREAAASMTSARSPSMEWSQRTARRRREES
jgi:hypothetical protein